MFREAACAGAAAVLPQYSAAPEILPSIAARRHYVGSVQGNRHARLSQVSSHGCLVAPALGQLVAAGMPGHWHAWDGTLP